MTFCLNYKQVSQSLTGGVQLIPLRCGTVLVNPHDYFAPKSHLRCTGHDRFPFAQLCVWFPCPYMRSYGPWTSCEKRKAGSCNQIHTVTATDRRAEETGRYRNRGAGFILAHRQSNANACLRFHIHSSFIQRALVVIKGRFSTNWTKFPLSLSMMAATMQSRRSGRDRGMCDIGTNTHHFEQQTLSLHPSILCPLLSFPCLCV